MGEPRDERDKRDWRETVGLIRGDVCAIFTQASVLVSRLARSSRLTSNVSLFTVL